jgi:hypothetical protein
LAIARHKEKINGKLHEKGMYEVRWRQDEGMIGWQTAAAKETAVAGRRIGRELQDSRDHQPRSIVPEGKRAGRAPQQRTKKMFLQTAGLSADPPDPPR